MAFRKFQAYLDDENLIRLQLDKDFAKGELRFSLEDAVESFLLKVQKVEPHENSLVYSLLAPEKLDLNKHYQVYDQDRNKAPLIFRQIVHRPAFDIYFDYDSDDLGASYSQQATQFKLWAPISEQVLLQVQDAQGKQQVFPLKQQEKGVWSVTVEGDLDGYSYFYLHKVNGQWQETHDPYALSSEANSGASFVINPAKLLNPSQIGRAQSQVPMTKAVIYELSVRDFSMQKDAGFEAAGKFQGLSESPQVAGHSLGLDYLKKLGISHVQLMPVYDFGSVDEEQPEAVYNWGYDPVQYNVPDGSFSKDPHDPYQRILDLQETIATYHQADISLIMDVVYNHVYDADSFAFEKIVPGYFFRVDAAGKRTNGSFCGNDVASERSMVRRYIKHSLKQWLTLYGFDGFRFDLMGLLDTETMQQIASELKELYPNVYLYGEGWKMETGLANELLAHQYNAQELPDYGFFSDNFRDTVKQTILKSEKLDSTNPLNQMANVLTANVGLVGSAHFCSPKQAINYTECHDNATVFDYFALENPQISLKERLANARLALHLVLLAQGVPFIHSGQEFFRSKDLIDNSYNVADHINRLDWLSMIEHKDDVNFIRKLIAFRKKQPLLSLESRAAILASCQITWLAPSLLQYQIKNQQDSITILINFSNQAQTYKNEANQALYVNYPQISLSEPLSIKDSYTIHPKQVLVLK